MHTACCLLFRVFIAACASQYSIFRLCEAENPCVLSLQEELRGNRSMSGGRGILGYQVGVEKFLCCYKETGSISRKPGTSWASKVTGILDTIEKQMEKDGETTGKELVRILKAEGVEASVSSVLRWRKDLGWTSKEIGYCQMICDVNKEKRLKFAHETKEMKTSYTLMKQQCKLNTQTDVQLQERLQTSLQTKAEAPTRGPCLGEHQLAWKGGIVHF